MDCHRIAISASGIELAWRSCVESRRFVDWEQLEFSVVSVQFSGEHRITGSLRNQSRALGGSEKSTSGGGGWSPYDNEELPPCSDDHMPPGLLSHRTKQPPFEGRHTGL